MARFLRRILADVIDDADMVSAFDQMGDIAVIRIPPHLYHKRMMIGQALLDNVKAVRAVFCQVSDVSGEYRTRDLERIAGEGEPYTTYAENGCRFEIDAQRVFFTPRLSTERARIAELVQPGETMLNMFGGAGPYSIQAAKHTACVVYNLDSNPYATKLCTQNIRLNKMAGRVVAITGDAADAIRMIPGECDRTIMPLPERTAEFAGAAVRATKNMGVIHYYSHVHADHKHDAPDMAARQAADTLPCDVRISHSRIVRAVGPRYYQTVVDVVIYK